jgi:DNA invertase Pin-like site-specific DNA recombinase
VTVIGYARVSTTDQDLSIQESALRAAGCEVIRAEKRSGATTAGREELRTVLDFMRKGDVLMVTRIDRLARSIGDLQDIVRALKAKGAALKATEQPIDTSTAAGKCFLDMLGVFAEFETNLRRERQLEGIAKAKAEACTKAGRRRSNVAKVREMRAQGIGAAAIAKALSIHRASVYRLRRRPTECGGRTKIAETARGGASLFGTFIALSSYRLSGSGSTFPRHREGSLVIGPSERSGPPPSEASGAPHLFLGGCTNVECFRSGRTLSRVGGGVSPSLANVPFNRNANPLFADVRALQHAR